MPISNATSSERSIPGRSPFRRFATASLMNANIVAMLPAGHRDKNMPSGKPTIRIPAGSDDFDTLGADWSWISAMHALRHGLELVFELVHSGRLIRRHAIQARAARPALPRN